MKTDRTNIIIRLIALLLVGSVVVLSVNKALFLHTHKLHDGRVVMHAHPFDKDTDTAPYKTHHHTTFSFLFFEKLELLFLNLPTIALAGLTCAHILRWQITNSEPNSAHFRLKQERAPPVFR